jgi:hypothetical protein
MAKLPPPVFFQQPETVTSPTLPPPLDATPEPLPPSAPINISPASLPNAHRLHAYSVQLIATGGNGPYSFALTSGNLPVNVFLSSAGLIHGTPSQLHQFVFSITVTDISGVTSTQAFQLQVVE